MDPEIKSVADLKGKSVSIGAPGSGVYFNAMDVLAAAGLTDKDIKAQYQSFADSADALKDGKIDAAFIVAGPPTPAITELFTTNEAYLVPIDGEIAEKVMAEGPFYTEFTIPAGTYNGQTEDVKTVTVKATLIVSADASEEDVYNLTAAIFDNIDAITAENAKGAELSIENATSGMTAPFHAGAAKYFAEKGVNVATE
jgi:TRAP transporter TAXI family solute receptor